jgi:uncharacterized membrane protein YphA (DoxX/SURF4 family)
MKDSKPIQLLTTWQIAGLIILSIRFVQGWIFWAGGSRRFIYAPSKLDPHSSVWLANKLQSAMPGALLGVGHIISYLLSHFWLLYMALIAFSLLELVSGICLILGLFSRISAFSTAIINIILMLSFGWEGGTCLDEWTMAVSSFAMALTLILSGSPIYSLDNLLLKRFPPLQQHNLFKLFASGPLSDQLLKRLAILFWIIAIIFTTTTYNYFRGAIFSEYHPGPVSPTAFQLTLSNSKLTADRKLQFTIQVSGGTTSVPSHIMRIELKDSTNRDYQTWTSQELAALPSDLIKNSYLYNKITTGPYGLVAPVSANATVTLPISFQPQQGINYILQVYTIDGKKWSTPITFSPRPAM